jgi:cytoskeletal protein CcmA (bactofilin family)
MVLNWFTRDPKDAGEWTGFLERGVKLEGKLETTGTFRVDAAMKGTLVSSETLILGENATVEGQIEGHLVIVAGQFDGTIHAAGKVEILPKAIVSGEIYTPCLIIEPGGMFDGRCHMISSSTHDATRAPVAIPIRSVVARAAAPPA